MTQLNLTPQQTQNIQHLLPEILKLCHWTSRSTQAQMVFGLDTETCTLHLSGACTSLGFLIPQVDRETQQALYKKGSGWKAHGLEPWDAEPRPPVGWRC